jgi:hypothetical protein
MKWWVHCNKNNICCHIIKNQILTKDRLFIQLQTVFIMIFQKKISQRNSRVRVFVHHATPRLPQSVTTLLVHPVKEQALTGGDPVRQVQDPMVGPEADHEKDGDELGRFNVQHFKVVSRG